MLRPRFLVTSHPPEWRPLERATCPDGPAHFLTKGADAALYAVLDAIVDGYFPVIDQLTEMVDELEDAGRSSDRTGPWSSACSRLVASLLLLRRAVSPEREVLNQLTNRENPLIDDETLVYFRDVYDHLVRVTDELDTHRELLVGGARGLPLDGQQQAVRRHEAPHRGHRGARRRRVRSRASSA